MGFKCSVEGCKSEKSKGSDVNLFSVSFENPKTNVEIERRQKWIDFIRLGKWDSWQPFKSTRVCSEHFAPEAFERR